MGTLFPIEPCKHFCPDADKIFISKSHTLCALVSSNDVEEKSWAVWNQVTDHVQPRGSHFGFINPLPDTNSIRNASACIEVVSKWFSLHIDPADAAISIAMGRIWESSSTPNSHLVPAGTASKQKKKPHSLPLLPNTHWGWERGEAARRALIELE